MQKALETLLAVRSVGWPGYDRRPPARPPPALDEAAEAERRQLLCWGQSSGGPTPIPSRPGRPWADRHDLLTRHQANQGHFHGLAARTTLVLPVFNRFRTPHRKPRLNRATILVRLNGTGQQHLKRGRSDQRGGLSAELASG